jgi:hypothetical protein
MTISSGKGKGLEAFSYQTRSAERVWQEFKLLGVTFDVESR